MSGSVTEFDKNFIKKRRKTQENTNLAAKESHAVCIKVRMGELSTQT